MPHSLRPGLRVRAVLAAAVAGVAVLTVQLAGTGTAAAAGLENGTPPPTVAGKVAFSAASLEVLCDGTTPSAALARFTVDGHGLKKDVPAKLVWTVTSPAGKVLRTSSEPYTVVVDKLDFVEARVPLRAQDGPNQVTFRVTQKSSGRAWIGTYKDGSCGKYGVLVRPIITVGKLQCDGTVTVRTDASMSDTGSDEWHTYLFLPDGSFFTGLVTPAGGTTSFTIPPDSGITPGTTLAVPLETRPPGDSPVHGVLHYGGVYKVMASQQVATGTCP